ncbi:MAG: hypothetical protein ABFR90_06700 [Planctomycetota bacterium]
MERKMLTNCLIVFMLITLSMSCGLFAAEQKEEDVTPIRGFPDASLTIFPVTMSITGPVNKNDHYRKFSKGFQRESRRKAGEFAETLGLLLEEKGFDNFEVTDTPFRFPAGKKMRKNRAAAFGKFVSEQNLKTDYALGIKFTVHIERSWQEVYWVMVDATGDIVWEDSRKPGDRGFEDYTGTELGRLELACSRLMPVMGLDKLPKKELAQDKKRALREMRAKEPPSHAEFDAMEKRLKTMKKADSSACVLVYPARVGGEHTDPACATRLSGLINEAKLCQATVAETGPVMEGAGWPNEMQVLWLFARAVRDHVRQNPPDSDYVLFADYWFAPRGEVWAVHFVVCDRAGDWVIVDLQNSHKEAFQQISPKNLEDCDHLVLERLKTNLQ